MLAAGIKHFSSFNIKSVININCLQVVPWGFRKMLRWIKQEYNNPPVFVTECGYSDDGQLQDKERVKYYVVSNYNQGLTSLIIRHILRTRPRAHARGSRP
jgi:hypothetical protein